MSPDLSRRGLTQIEVLVTMLVILLIIALVLPVVGRVREVSHGSQCKDHLHNLAIAAERYVSHHGVLPPGSLAPHRPVRSEPGGDGFSWFARLLPHIEQKPLYDLIDWSLPPERQAPAVFGAQIDVVQCPTAGTLSDAMPATATYAGVHHPVETPIDVDNHGLFVLGRGIRPVEIPDGQSHTLLIGEKDVPRDDRGWLMGGRSTLRNTERPFGRYTSRALAPPTGDPLAVGGFASAHPHGVNVAFADGAVWLLSFEVDLALLHRLADRRDGELVNITDFLPVYAYEDQAAKTGATP
jgi:prepilin-type processing-associated H-X9-DG protein